MTISAFVDLLEKGPNFRVRAQISVIKTEDGGRRGPFMSGYSPNHNFGDANNRNFYVGRIDTGKDWVYPGETKEVWVQFLYGRYLEKQLIVGRKWRIQEGDKLFAIAKVLEVVEE